MRVIVVPSPARTRGISLIICMRLLAGADVSQELLQPTVPSSEAEQQLFFAPLAAYDAIWGLALAGAAVQPEDGATIGTAVYHQLTSGSVTFEGVSGRVAWESNGDRDASDVAVDISFMYPREGDVQLQSLAIWTPSDGLSLRGIVVPDIWAPITARAPSPCAQEDPEPHLVADCPTLCPVGLVVGVAIGVGVALLGLVIWALHRRYHAYRVRKLAPLSPSVSLCPLSLGVHHALLHYCRGKSPTTHAYLASYASYDHIDFQSTRYRAVTPN